MSEKCVVRDELYPFYRVGSGAGEEKHGISVFQGEHLTTIQQVLELAHICM